MSEPRYIETPARGLIGRRMLIVEIHSVENDDVLRVHAQVKAKKHKGKKKARIQYVCFKAGVVVRQQLEEHRFFPVWARLSMVQGKKHEYYQLDLAGTFEVVCRRDKQKRWRVFFDPKKEDWAKEEAQP